MPLNFDRTLIEGYFLASSVVGERREWVGFAFLI
jgi:hypothetical protein